jgi:hypothetical protein
MAAMSSRSARSRWSAWAFAVALLLKAAMPLLAAGSAHAQGKALVEVCTVYGVATVALDSEPSQPGHDAAPSHAGDHCVLGGMVGFAAVDASVPVPPRSDAQPLGQRCVKRLVLADACAAWMARLEHAPPRFA